MLHTGLLCEENMPLTCKNLQINVWIYLFLTTGLKFDHFSWKSKQRNLLKHMFYLSGFWFLITQLFWGVASSPVLQPLKRCPSTCVHRHTDIFGVVIQITLTCSSLTPRVLERSDLWERHTCDADLTHAAWLLSGSDRLFFDAFRQEKRSVW